MWSAVVSASREQNKFSSLLQALENEEKNCWPE